MASIKRLSSVAHSLAHHAVSALSCLHPHLKHAALELNEDPVAIDILDVEKIRIKIKLEGPLYMAIGELRSTAERILKAEGFTPEDLSKFELRFRFPDNADDYSSICWSEIVSITGKKATHCVDYLGRTHNPNKYLVPEVRTSPRTG